MPRSGMGHGKLSRHEMHYSKENQCERYVRKRWKWPSVDPSCVLNVPRCLRCPTYRDPACYRFVPLMNYSDEVNWFAKKIFLSSFKWKKNTHVYARTQRNVRALVVWGILGGGNKGDDWNEHYANATSQWTIVWPSPPVTPLNATYWQVS